MSVLRIGWIGCGTHANEMLLPQVMRHQVRLQALCDVSDERLQETARRYGVAEADLMKDWRALLARDDLDAIGMAVGPHLHHEIGLAAIARGLPIFIEKPPAATAKAARELADASAARGVPVVLGFMKRYSTANRIAANLVHDDKFGIAASFLGQYMTAPTYFEKDVDYTGFFLHHCVHYFDLVPHLMGEVAQVSSRRFQLEPGKLLLHVDFAFTSGGIGTLVMGTQATLRDHEDTLVWEPNFTVAANEDHKGYHTLLGDFVAVARGEKRQVPDAVAGARAMALLEQALASSHT